MLGSITLILACQLVGEAIVHLLDLSLPGPVLGMILLFLLLLIRGRVGRPLDRVARGLLANLGMLFIPVAVGVMSQTEVLKAEALPITIALIVSTVASMLVTGWAMQLLDRRARKEKP